ncbi:hypothetical protein M1563_00630 [Patescibacteria group bacterium]|nr:hypothetical protein [Patescibacteria group bacterium]MCL5410123.1 hypothetical protein [Patescibacteria group bacterium]
MIEADTTIQKTVWRGFGLTGESLDQFIKTESDRINLCWAELLQEESLDLASYRRLSKKIGSFGVNVTQRCLQLANSDEPSWQDSARQVWIGNLLSSVVHSVEKQTKESNSSLDETDLISQGIETSLQEFDSLGKQDTDQQNNSLNQLNSSRETHLHDSSLRIHHAIELYQRQISQPFLISLLDGERALAVEQNQIAQLLRGMDLAEWKETLVNTLSMVTFQNQRNRLIMQLRFGLNDTFPHTLAEIGQTVGITRERVRVIIEKLLRSFRFNLYKQRAVKTKSDHLATRIYLNGIVNGLYTGDRARVDALSSQAEAKILDQTVDADYHHISGIQAEILSSLKHYPLLWKGPRWQITGFYYRELTNLGYQLPDKFDMDNYILWEVIDSLTSVWSLTYGRKQVRKTRT